MKIYILRADVNKYRNFSPLNSGDWERVFNKFDGRNLASSWTNVAVSYINDEINKDLPLGDFPYLTSHVPVFSERAKNILSDEIDSEGQFLPLKCSTGNYYAFNVTNIIDVLDQEKSIIKYFQNSGRIKQIVKHIFIEEKLSNTKIFKLPHFPLVHTYVTDRFVSLVEEANLAGFHFVEI